MKINKVGMSNENFKAIELLLSQSTHNPPELEDIWQIMDNVWDKIGCNSTLSCNNRNIEWDKISKFYSHPVWLLNGWVHYLILTEDKIFGVEKTLI